jgi:hypothetical protein
MRDCFAIKVCHCEFTTVNVAIFITSTKYEIASVVSLPRKDMVTPSLHNLMLKGFMI